MLRYTFTSSRGDKATVIARDEQQGRDKAMRAIWGGNNFVLQHIFMPYIGLGLDLTGIAQPGLPALEQAELVNERTNNVEQHRREDSKSGQDYSSGYQQIARRRVL